MVSVLENYYHIPKEDSYYFQYQHINYCLSKQKLKDYYAQYISLTHFPSYEVVNNINNSIYSNEYILYKYNNLQLNVKEIINYSLVVVDKISIKKIKENWIRLMDDCMNLSHKDIDYYCFGLGMLAIDLLNKYFNEKEMLPVGFQHIECYPTVQYICNPDNIILATRVDDLQELFDHGLIDDDEFKQIIEKHLTNTDMMILICKEIFPRMYYYNIINGRKYDMSINYKRNKILSMIGILREYIDIPEIKWI